MRASKNFNRFRKLTYKVKQILHHTKFDSDHTLTQKQMAKLSAPKEVTKEPFMQTKQTTDDACSKKKALGRRHIDIKYIDDKTNRGVTLSKRKGGLFKKGEELAKLCDVEVLQVILTKKSKIYIQTSRAFRHLADRFGKTGDDITNVYYECIRRNAVEDAGITDSNPIVRTDAFRDSIDVVDNDIVPTRIGTKTSHHAVCSSLCNDDVPDVSKLPE
jgi:hypothetical protein